MQRLRERERERERPCSPLPLIKQDAIGGCKGVCSAKRGRAAYALPRSLRPSSSRHHKAHTYAIPVVSNAAVLVLICNPQFHARATLTANQRRRLKGLKVSIPYVVHSLHERIISALCSLVHSLHKLIIYSMMYIHYINSLYIL